MPKKAFNVYLEVEVLILVKLFEGKNSPKDLNFPYKSFIKNRDKRGQSTEAKKATLYFKT